MVVEGVESSCIDDSEEEGEDASSPLMSSSPPSGMKSSPALAGSCVEMAMVDCGGWYVVLCMMKNSSFCTIEQQWECLLHNVPGQLRRDEVSWEGQVRRTRQKVNVHRLSR